MPTPPKLRCFISMKYGVPWIDPVFDIVKDAAKSVGLEVFRSDEKLGPADPLRKEITQEIDESLILVCEGSSLSWYVAYELAYADLNRKPYILLVQDLPSELNPYEERVVDKLFSDVRYITYSLSSSQDRRNAEDKIATAIHTTLNKFVPSLRTIADEVSGKDIPELPGRYVDPIIKWRGEKLGAQSVWEAWSKGFNLTNPIALISPPGYGKSAFLAKFVYFIRRQTSSEVDNADQLPKWFRFIDLSVMAETVTDAWPKEFLPGKATQETASIHTMVPERIDSSYHIPVDAYRKAGFAYLLLDGLDEFGLHRGKELPLLMEQCKRLSDLGTNVIITSRKWFWDEKVKGVNKEDFEVAEMLRFNKKQALELIKGVRLHPSVRKKIEQGVQWLLSPLLLIFIMESDPIGFKTKTDIYTEWTKSIAKKDLNRIRERLSNTELTDTDVLRFFAWLAFLLVQKRTNEVDEEVCREASELNGTDKEIISDDIIKSDFLVSMRATEDEGMRAKFAHASLNEFFIATQLENDYRAAIEANGKKKETLHLANVDLDYVMAPVYGFLYEKLGKEYERQLVAWLNDEVNLMTSPERLVRNLVEYLGFTSQGKDPETIRTLLKVVDLPSVGALIRYNAVRALERLHHSSPTPYFDLISDWDKGTWGDYEILKAVWKIRGAHKEKRVPDQGSMAILPQRAHEQIPHELCVKVVQTFVRLLEGPDEEHFPNKTDSSPNIDYVHINCSHALVRWFDFDDADLETRIEALLQTRESDEELFDNLTILMERRQQR